MIGGPDLLERVRMCLAEVGEPTDGVQMANGVVITPGVIPSKTAWRAASVARHADGAKQMCWQCRSTLPKWCTDRALDAVREACLAIRPCMEDCGLERGSVDVGYLLPWPPLAFLLLALFAREPMADAVGFVGTVALTVGAAAVILAVGYLVWSVLLSAAVSLVGWLRIGGGR